jgi:hypothetical protein
MFTVKEGKLYYEKRLALVRDLIIPESVLRSINFDEDKKCYSTHVVVNGTLIYVIKYKELESTLSNMWHFAVQSFSKMGNMYESECLYLGI